MSSAESASPSAPCHVSNCEKNHFASGIVVVTVDRKHGERDVEILILVIHRTTL